MVIYIITQSQILNIIKYYKNIIIDQMPLYIRIFELTIAANSTKKIRVKPYLLFQSFNFWLYYFLF